MLRFFKALFNLIFKLILLAFVLTGVAGMIWGPQEMIQWVRPNSAQQNSNQEDVAYFKVRRDTLQIGLTERGSLRATKNVGIFHKQPRTLRFNWLEIEGKIVKKDDVIARFETKDFEEKIAEEEKNLGQYLENLEVAKKAIGITESSGELMIAKAETELKNATEDLKKFKQLDVPKKLKELSDAKLVARKELETALAKLTEKQEVIDNQQYNGEEEFETALKAVSDAEDELKKARQKEKDASLARKLYQSYDYKKELRQKEEAVATSKLSQTEAKVSATNQLAQKKAEVRKIEDSIERTKKNIKELKETLDACNVKAPVDGRLLYGDVVGGWPRKSDIAVGKEMWDGYNFFTIPDETSFMIDTFIAEEYRHKIKEGVRAKITLDALPDLQIEGEVSQIESFAKENQGGPKTYKTEISIKNSSPEMISGMSVTVDIIAETLENVLLVPIETVYNEEKQIICFVKSETGNQKRIIKTGKSNDDFVQIIEGLEEKEEVSLLGEHYGSQNADSSSTTTPKNTDSETENKVQEIVQK